VDDKADEVQNKSFKRKMLNKELKRKETISEQIILLENSTANNHLPQRSNSQVELTLLEKVHCSKPKSKRKFSKQS
jgi:hypothetical protein